ncbi:DUF2726 domain-containing protein [Cereibacter sp. SYSU M97828]|nr:DUF2726 domain-containing protein [Cereibacter flavus]
MLPLSDFVLTLGIGAVALAAAFAIKRVAGRYTARPVLNKSEQRLFSILTSAVATLPAPQPQLLCQVNYGEFLSSRSRAAFFRINAKRCDFLLVDREFRPVLVIEYQGAGHYGSGRTARRSAVERDRVKRRALASAGVPLMEIPASYEARSIRETLHATFAPADAERSNDAG